MDPKEYDRIADMLMQIRSKIDNINPKDELSKMMKVNLLDHLHKTLEKVDKIAEWDAQGWL